MSLGLGIDAGGSATRWTLKRGEDVVAAGEVGPVSGHLFAPGVREASLASLEALRVAVTAVAHPDAVVAGITGLSTGAETAGEIKAILARDLLLDPRRILVTSDMWIAYRAAFRPGEGALVYTGTGSAGIHITADGKVLRVGGHGVVIDDAGGAHWIAREALRHVVRRLDEEPEAAGGEPLARALFRLLGGDTWDEIRIAVYGTDRGGVAKLAPAVGAAAAAGDATARDILERAGCELARLGDILRARAGIARVALAGGARRLSPLIFESFRAALPADAEAGSIEIDAVGTAARLAVQRGARALAGGPAVNEVGD